mmetsp:Transcript_5571/g.15961  ORF Transcript_5571/g.15961 Transcript_5571/m.15961 type:complete len:253 (+) Transcript_5571:483-1241(+)
MSCHVLRELRFHEAVEYDLPDVEVHLIAALAVGGGVDARHRLPALPLPQHVVRLPRHRQRVGAPALLGSPSQPAHPVYVMLAARGAVRVAGHGIKVHEADLRQTLCPLLHRLVAAPQPLEGVFILRAPSRSRHKNHFHLVPNAFQILHPLLAHLATLLQKVNCCNQDELLPGRHCLTVRLQMCDLPCVPGREHAVDGDDGIPCRTAWGSRGGAEEGRHPLQHCRRLHPPHVLLIAPLRHGKRVRGPAQRVPR